MEGRLRDRKKAATRLAISDVATRLFGEHGFEQVTLAQIAEAADVSVKTIFNYFSSKEELFFDREQDVLDALVTAVRDRGPGSTVLGSLRAVLADRMTPFHDGWPVVGREGLARYRAFVATERASPVLRARRLVIADRWSGALAPILADELGLPVDDDRARVLASMLIAVMGTRERTMTTAVMDGEPPAEVERRVRAVVSEAFDRLERAFGDLDRPRA